MYDNVGFLRIVKDIKKDIFRLKDSCKVKKKAWTCFTLFKYSNSIMYSGTAKFLLNKNHSVCFDLQSQLR
jgi:hypothetical protein